MNNTVPKNKNNKFNKKLYTIGCTLYTPISKTEGFYIVGEYGLPYILKDLDKLIKNDRIIIFDNNQNAQNYMRYLSRCYRSEFRSQVKRGKHLKCGKFYLLRINKEYEEKINKHSIEITCPSKGMLKECQGKYYKIL